MDNLATFVSYESVDGGVNNLQVVKVFRPAPYRGLVDIVKTYTSRRNQALSRALSFIKKSQKNNVHRLKKS
jgi:hypothetical protein